MPKTALAIACHPDDIEFVMAGTLLLLKDRGYETHYMNVANGSMGTSEYTCEQIIEIRRQEAMNAAESLGAVYHESLVDDLGVFYDSATCMKLCSIVRQIEPEILLVQSPQDYMEDHQNAVRLAVTAAFCRGMRNTPVNPPCKPGSQDVTVYHAQPHGNRDALRKIVRAGLYVDIESVLDRKKTALGMHKSQQSWLDESQKMNAYLENMVEMAVEVGTLSKRYQFAEGWRRRNHLGFCDPDADPLFEALFDLSHIDTDYEASLNL
jgi:Uncharacterized proteins, LmbE homologs